jgi:predicted nucleic acid-binding protein
LTVWVVDASVAVKWFVPEVHSGDARRLLVEGHALMAPELLMPEVGHILWKKHRIGELEAVEAHDILADLRRMPLRLVGMSSTIESALALAIQYGRTVYDSVYRALAIHQGASFVTADQKLCNSLAGTEIAHHVTWIKDIS